MGKTHASFDPTAFEDLIAAKGLEYRWSRALTCSCRLATDVSRTWNPACERCNGEGWLYVNPHFYREPHVDRDYVKVKAVFSSMVIDEVVNDEVIGRYADGRGTMTVPADVKVAYRDRFIAIEQEMAYSEVLVRGSAAEVPIGRHGLTTDEQATAMRYEPIRINYVESDDDGTAEIYYPTTDFQLTQAVGDSPRRLKWEAGRGPAEGVVYTVHYDVHPVWIVEAGQFHIQHSVGPANGRKGRNVRQSLPTTFGVKLDYITDERA